MAGVAACLAAPYPMKAKVDRRTVDLSGYPELVVIYLGMRVNTLAGLKTLMGFGPRIAESVQAQPDGLLLHENLLFSLFPMHAGMRQYWRDFESLESWARSQPHREWWQTFLRDSTGQGSGTKPTSCGAAWRLSMTTWSRTRAFFVSRRCNRLEARCSPLAVAPDTPETL